MKTCIHRHTIKTHPRCFAPQERIAFLDIETSNLKANFGICLSWAVLGEDNKLKFDVLKPSDFRNKTFDKRIIKSVISELSKYDRIVGHYSTKFDIPFLRTRALIHKLPFIPYGVLKHTDTCLAARHLLKLSSNRQDVIAEALRGSSLKTRLKSHHWINALRGEPKALAYVLDHNIKDVYELKLNYKALKPYLSKTRRSL